MKLVDQNIWNGWFRPKTPRLRQAMLPTFVELICQDHWELFRFQKFTSWACQYDKTYWKVGICWDEFGCSAHLWKNCCHRLCYCFLNPDRSWILPILGTRLILPILGTRFPKFFDLSTPQIFSSGIHRKPDDRLCESTLVQFNELNPSMTMDRKIVISNFSNTSSWAKIRKQTI